MGLLELFKPQPSAPTIISILPNAAKQEILFGRLPILNTDKIFLKAEERCHYIDKAIYEKKRINKRLVRQGNSYSMPGLFKGTRINMGKGQTDVVDSIQYDTIRGILYITNKRIIFVGDSESFDKKVEDLIAITPFSNCVELHFSKDIYKLFVPDGSITHAVLQQIR